MSEMRTCFMFGRVMPTWRSDDQLVNSRDHLFCYLVVKSMYVRYLENSNVVCLVIMKASHPISLTKVREKVISKLILE